MKRVNSIILLILLGIGLVAIAGCRAGGADISLPGLSLGMVTMEGQPISGLPSDKIDLLLEVSAQTVQVNHSTEGTILTLLPSGATIEIKASGISIKGLEPEQVKVQWVTGSKSD